MSAVWWMKGNINVVINGKKMDAVREEGIIVSYLINNKFTVIYCISISSVKN